MKTEERKCTRVRHSSGRDLAVTRMLGGMPRSMCWETKNSKTSVQPEMRNDEDASHLCSQCSGVFDTDWRSLSHQSTEGSQLGGICCCSLIVVIATPLVLTVSNLSGFGRHWAQPALGDAEVENLSKVL